MKVVIITDGGAEIGFGHIVRCTALYYLFEQKKIDVKFIVNGDKYTASFLEGKNFQIINWLKKRESVFKCIEKDDIVIVDSYNVDDEFYEKIAALADIGVYINGNKRLNYPRGMVVKGSLYAKMMKYPEKKGVTYLQGAEYVMLRKEFWQSDTKKTNREVKSFMVTFGGEDIRNLTPRIMQLLGDNYPELKKNIIIGKGYRNIKEIEKIKDSNTNLIFYATAPQMRDVMLNSDIAISSGGQSLYELARIGVSTIAICCAENQILNLKSWQEIGFIEYAGKFDDNNLQKNILKAIKNLESSEERLKRHGIGIAAVDGRGAERVFKKIMFMRGQNA